MLEYSELREAVDNGYIIGSKVNIVRRDGKIFDYVLPGEVVRPWEVSFLKYRNNLYYILDFLLTLLMRFPSFFASSFIFSSVENIIKSTFLRDWQKIFQKSRKKCWLILEKSIE